MIKKLVLLIGFITLQNSAQLFATDLGINVILANEIKPGYYGEVQIGNAPPPRIVYTRPITIVKERRYYEDEPVYLHVPPGHARHWSKHCAEYRACSRKVYFVRSEEYDPQYQRYERERNYNERHPHKHHRP